MFVLMLAKETPIEDTNISPINTNNSNFLVDNEQPRFSWQIIKAFSTRKKTKFVVSLKFYLVEYELLDNHLFTTSFVHSVLF